jgi:hypothetical protein
MKQFLLPVLLWSLAISPIFAQSQMPSEAHYYVTELSLQSQRLLQIAGLLDPTTDEMQIESRATDLRLDSTATFHNYSPTDSMPKSLTWYMYPQDNATVNIDFAWDVDHWVISNRTTTLTDESGRIVDVIAQRWDETAQTYVPESRLEVFPHGDSHTLIDSFFVSVYVEGGTWSREFSTWNSFDNADRITESESEFVFFGESLTLLDKYLYANDLLDKIETYQVFEGEEMLGSVQFYLYQDGLVWATMTHVAAGIGELIPETREEYTYDEHGQLILQNHYIYDFEKQDWKFYQADSYIYNALGRVTLQELVTIDGAGVTTRTRTLSDYINDEYINVQENTLYDFASDAWHTIDKTFYYYSELVAVDPELPADADELIMFPNPTTGAVNLQVDGETKVYVYGMNGQLLNTAVIREGQALELHFLPAGVYQVRANTESAHFAGKLIKQ